MFRTATLDQLRPTVVQAVSDLYEKAANNQKNPNDIVLFLVNGHVDVAIPRVYTKFRTGPGIEGIDDYPRFEFLIAYLNFGNEKPFDVSWSDEEINRHRKYTINLELMIYTHLWEAEQSLKCLKQLANLVARRPYQWEIEIPWMTKHDFIRNEIKQVFLDNNLEVGKIVQESYHSQLRNAFAHGNYTFFESSHIKLNNYRGEPWELRALSFDEWEERFLKSALLHYEIMNQRQACLKEFGKKNPTVTVWLPKDKEATFYRSELVWYEDTQDYAWKNN